MVSATDGERFVLVRSWLSAALCWCALYGAGRPTSGQPAPAEARLTPKAWIQQYLSADFPNSARHFELYYAAGDEEVVLFSFDIAGDDMQRLMDGTGIFPGYGDLTRGSSGLPEQIVRDAGSRHFAQRIASMKNAMSASKDGTTLGVPLTVQLWTAQVSVGRWTVCVCVIADSPAGSATVYGGFRMPSAAQEVHSHVVIDSRSGPMEDTSVCQRWSLAEADSRAFIQMVNARSDVVRYSGPAAERLARRLDAVGSAPEATWWKPSDLTQSPAGNSEPLEGFVDQGSGVSSALVMGRVGDRFRCYAQTRRRVLATDPPDAIWRLLGLALPASARDAHYASASSMAGEVAWIRFDLPLGDFVVCLAETPTLPVYAEFTAAAGPREHLVAAYRSGAPEWWRPQELDQGVYARRTRSEKELHGVAVGFGRLSGENIRVYIGAFSAW